MTKKQFTCNGDDPYLTTRQAAKRLGVTIRTIQLWAEAGRLTYLKTMGGHRRIRHSEISRLNNLSEVQAANLSKQCQVLMIASHQQQCDEWVGWLDAAEQDNIAGAVLRLCSNAYSGLIMMGRRIPDLLIVDMDNPDMSMLSMLHTVCSHPGYEEMDVLGITQRNHMKETQVLSKRVKVISPALSEITARAWLKTYLDEFYCKQERT